MAHLRSKNVGEIDTKSFFEKKPGKRIFEEDQRATTQLYLGHQRKRQQRPKVERAGEGCLSFPIPFQDMRPSLFAVLVFVVLTIHGRKNCG